NEQNTYDGELSIIQKQHDNSGKLITTNSSSAPRAWTEEEERQLSSEFSSGMTITEIANAHKRTKGAIRSRLRKMGIIS
ncbi:hypothetical protein, partial [Ruminococcus sp.]